MGGEHSISQGAIKAYKEKYKRLSVLQLDAHLDLMEQFGGTRYSHASVSRRVVEDLGCKVTSFGVRVVSKEEHNFLRSIRTRYRYFLQKISTITIPGMRKP